MTDTIKNGATVVANYVREVVRRISVGVVIDTTPLSQNAADGQRDVVEINVFNYPVLNVQTGDAVSINILGIWLCVSYT